MRYQIRMMMAVILRAGEGLLTPAEIQAMLEARDKEASRFNAPAKGLYLVHALYPKEIEERCGTCWPPEGAALFRK